jgi:hypothetical protein
MGGIASGGVACCCSFSVGDGGDGCGWRKGIRGEGCKSVARLGPDNGMGRQGN